MAKGSGNDDRAKVKLRVIEFELEGGNAAVENSIRQLSNTLTTRNGGLARGITPPKQKELATGGNPAETTEVEEVIQDTEPIDASTEATLARNRREQNQRANHVCRNTSPT